MHPYIAAVLSNMADVYNDQVRREQAVAIHEHITDAVGTSYEEASSHAVGE